MFLLLGACGEPRLECGTAEIQDTVSSIVRDQVLRIISDSAPLPTDARRNAMASKATKVTLRNARLIEWDKSRGQLACSASIVIAAPGTGGGWSVETTAELRYRVTRGDQEAFFVRVPYPDLMAVLATRTGPAPSHPQ
ncbi:MAG: hypothetical protein GZ089_01435 [Aromatoleum sp.]|nr:hypothetical protein [Aromatoleum sp.]